METLRVPSVFFKVAFTDFIHDSFIHLSQNALSRIHPGIQSGISPSSSSEISLGIFSLISFLFSGSIPRLHQGFLQHFSWVYFRNFFIGSNDKPLTINSGPSFNSERKDCSIELSQVFFRKSSQVSFKDPFNHSSRISLWISAEISSEIPSFIYVMYYFFLIVQLVMNWIIFLAYLINTKLPQFLFRIPLGILSGVPPKILLGSFIISYQGFIQKFILSFLHNRDSLRNLSKNFFRDSYNNSFCD